MFHSFAIRIMKINYMHNTAPEGRAAEAVMRHGQYF